MFARVCRWISELVELHGSNGLISTHICRLKDDTDDSDATIVLGDDCGVCVEALHRGLFRVIYVADQHRTVDGLQERDKTLYTVIELVVANGLNGLHGCSN